MYDSREGVQLRRRRRLPTVAILLLFIFLLMVMTTGCTTLNQAFSRPVIELKVLGGKTLFDY